MITALQFLVLDVIGLCPPVEYHEGGMTNPYWLYNKFEDQSTLPGDLTDASFISNPTIPLLDSHSPSLFFSGEEGDDIGIEIGAGASVDLSSLTDSGHSIFQDDDPLLSNDAGTNLLDMSFDSALMAPNDFGVGPDYSLFDGTA